jgi:hypothetical protein
LLNGETSIPAAEEPESATEVPQSAAPLDMALSGGKINPNGTQPPDL